MTEFKPIKEGKVREIYDNGDSLIMVATDRISAFDVILKNKVTNKGKVLTQMSRFWFDYTRDVLPNHMLSVDTADMPEFFRTPAFEAGHEVPQADHAAHRVHRARLHHRQRLGQLPAERHRLRHPPARACRNPSSCPSPSTLLPPRLRSATTMRTSATRRALRCWKSSSRPWQGLRHQAAGLHHCPVQEVRRVCPEPRHHHCRYQVRVWSG